MPSNAASTWSLDPRLASDTALVGDLPLSRLLVMNDANYPWLVLVPRRPDLVELLDLSGVEQTTLIGEIAQTSWALKRSTNCDKLNVAALGNTVRQLHVHVIARNPDDAAGPRPVWGVAPARAYTAADLARLIQSLRLELKLA